MDVEVNLMKSRMNGDWLGEFEWFGLKCNNLN